MILIRARQKESIIVITIKDVLVRQIKSADFIKDIWKDQAIVALWFKILFYLVKDGMSVMMHLCFHLVVCRKRQICFMTKLLMEY